MVIGVVQWKQEDGYLQHSTCERQSFKPLAATEVAFPSPRGDAPQGPDPGGHLSTRQQPPVTLMNYTRSAQEPLLVNPSVC